MFAPMFLRTVNLCYWFPVLEVIGSAFAEAIMRLTKYRMWLV